MLFQAIVLALAYLNVGNIVRHAHFEPSNASLTTSFGTCSQTAHAPSSSSLVRTRTEILSMRACLCISLRNCSGVGFGICHRLLSQLTIGGRHPVSNGLELDCDGLILILACRSKQRAEAARVKLCDIADELVLRARHSPDYDGHAEIFRKNLHIAIHTIDLANIQSVFHFADEVARKYVFCVHLESLQADTL